MIELVNQIGSAFYGPVLAVFALGVLAPRVSAHGALARLAAGFGGNWLIAACAPGVSWLWWNPAGFAIAVAVALAWSRTGMTVSLSLRPWSRRETALLLGAFVGMLAILVALAWLAARASGKP